MRIEEIITQTQQQSSTNELRMVLRPTTLNVRRNFRNRLENQINNSETNRLPYLNRIEDVELIDNKTIIGLNNTTSSERRIKFMESIRNYENVNENSYYLITNSTNQLRTYLPNLLIAAASVMIISIRKTPLTMHTMIVSQFLNTAYCSA